MRDLNHNIKTICVLSILVLMAFGYATAASTTTNAHSNTDALSFSAPTVAATTAPKILITEIFPNPKGKDENKEWIELFNAENEPVNLDGWQIVQTSAGKKKSEKFYMKNLKIDAKSYALIDKKNIKKPLKNKDNTIALTNPSGEVVVKIYYKLSEEEKSLSLTKIIDTTVPTAKNTSAQQNTSILNPTTTQPAKTKYVWLWTFPSKGEKNKDFYYLEGKIAGTNNNIFTFSINQNDFLKQKNQSKSLPGQTLPTNNKQLTIRYKNINPLLLKIFSKQKTTLTIFVGKENTKLILIKIIHAR